MYKLLITGNNFVKPEFLRDALAESVCQKYPIEVEILKFTDVPAPGFPLCDSTVVPSGMSVEDPNAPKPPCEGIREYYGAPLSLLPVIKDVDFLVLHGSALPREVIDRAERLKWVLVMRGGPVNVDQEYLREKGIPLYHTEGRNASGVAELTVGLLLTLKRHIHESNFFLRNNYWNLRFNTYETAGTELFGKTCGLIGFGNIARHLAGLLSAFGAKVMAYDPYVSPDVFGQCSVLPVSLEELLKESDIVSLHARLKKGQPPLIGAAEIRAMKTGAILVNTARGALLDYSALYEALVQGKLGGAALDVYGSEPFLLYKKLLALPNVIGTGHLGGVSREAVDRGTAMTAGMIEELLKKEIGARE